MKQLKCAVFKVTVSDVAPAPQPDDIRINATLSEVDSFFKQMSGFTVGLSYHLFGWIHMSETQAQKNALETADPSDAKHFKVLRRRLREQIPPGAGYHTADWDLELYLMYDASHGGYTPGPCFVGAQDLSASLIEHELGHALGAYHSAQAPDPEYGDPFCPMGSNFAWAVTRGTPPITSGPGYCAGTMRNIHFLPEEDVLEYLPTDSEASFDLLALHRSLVLNPLHGAPRFGVRALFIEDIPGPFASASIEYRERTGYDVALAPELGDPAPGVVVAHLHAGASSAPGQSKYVGHTQALAGHALTGIPGTVVKVAQVDRPDVVRITVRRKSIRDQIFTPIHEFDPAEPVVRR